MSTERENRTVVIDQGIIQATITQAIYESSRAQWEKMECRRIAKSVLAALAGEGYTVVRKAEESGVDPR